MNQIFLMGLIANRGLRKKYLAFFEEHHITVVLSTMAAGTASNTILDALGLEATEKTVYFALLTRDTWKSLKKELYEKMNIAVPGRGIAFLIPLSSIGGRKTLQYLTAGQTIEIEEESTLQKRNRCRTCKTFPWHLPCGRKRNDFYRSENKPETGDYEIYHGTGRHWFPGRRHCLLPAGHQHCRSSASRRNGTVIFQIASS